MSPHEEPAGAAHSEERVLYESVRLVGYVTINRPERRNALDRQGTEALLNALEVAADDDSVRCVVLRGSGASFCVGGDLAEPPGSFADREHELTWTRRQVRVVELLRSMVKPTIASVRGACAGIGFSLACATDMRCAGSSAIFVTAYRTAGLSGDGGGSWTLPRLVGEGKARELYYLSPRVDAQTALGMGLVNWVIPDAELDQRVGSIAEAVAGGPPLALQAMKQNFLQAAASSFEDYLDVETQRHVQCRHSRDADEAASAFLEKREPKYVGQ